MGCWSDAARGKLDDSNAAQSRGISSVCVEFWLLNIVLAELVAGRQKLESDVLDGLSSFPLGLTCPSTAGLAKLAGEEKDTPGLFTLGRNILNPAPARS